MAKDWSELTKMTGDEPLVIERVRLAKRDIIIEGSFDLPPMARLSLEDQIFSAAFVKSHGSIKEMERLFGVSYPTIKSRLNRIGDLMDFVDVETVSQIEEPIIEDNTLDRLERGEITAQEALKILKSKKTE